MEPKRRRTSSPLTAGPDTGSCFLELPVSGDLPQEQKEELNEGRDEVGDTSLESQTSMSDKEMTADEQFSGGVWDKLPSTGASRVAGYFHRASSSSQSAPDDVSEAPGPDYPLGFRRRSQYNQISPYSFHSSHEMSDEAGLFSATSSAQGHYRSGLQNVMYPLKKRISFAGKEAFTDITGKNLKKDVFGFPVQSQQITADEKLSVLEKMPSTGVSSFIDCSYAPSDDRNLKYQYQSSKTKDEMGEKSDQVQDLRTDSYNTYSDIPYETPASSSTTRYGLDMGSSLFSFHSRYKSSLYPQKSQNVGRGVIYTQASGLPVQSKHPGGDHSAKEETGPPFTDENSRTLEFYIACAADPVTMSGMKKSHYYATRVLPGVSQDDIREMEPPPTAGPSTLQLSTSVQSDHNERSEQYEQYEDLHKTFSLGAGHIYSSASQASDEILNTSVRDTVIIPNLYRWKAPSLPAPPPAQSCPVIQDSSVFAEGSRARGGFDLLSLRYESKSGGDSEVLVEMEAPVQAVNYSATNTLPTHRHLQTSPSDPSWTERGSRCLTRSHSFPPLSQKTFGRSHSSPEMELKTNLRDLSWINTGCAASYRHVSMPEALRFRFSAADVSPGVSQDDTREMEPPPTAGPSSPQLSSYDGINDDESYQNCHDLEEIFPLQGDYFCFNPPQASDEILNTSNIKDTDDVSSFDTVIIPDLSQSKAPSLPAPPPAQRCPVIKESAVFAEGSRDRGGFDLLSLQSESESGGDSDARLQLLSGVCQVNIREMEPPPTAGPSALQLSTNNETDDDECYEYYEDLDETWDEPPSLHAAQPPQRRLVKPASSIFAERRARGRFDLLSLQSESESGGDSDARLQLLSEVCQVNIREMEPPPTAGPSALQLSTNNETDDDGCYENYEDLDETWDKPPSLHAAQPPQRRLVKPASSIFAERRARGRFDLLSLQSESESGGDSDARLQLLSEVCQVNIREMELPPTAGPSALQLSTNNETDDDECYEYYEDLDETWNEPPSLHAAQPPQSCPVIKDSAVFAEGSRDQGGFDLLSLQSESKSGGDSEVLVEMEAPVQAVNYLATNTLPTHRHLQTSPSDPGWTERGSRCLTRSHSFPPLSQKTSAKTFGRSRSSPDVELKTSVEEFTPDVTADEDDETFIFRCSCPGLYQCSVTSLLFHMEGGGDVVYRIVPWNRRLLAQHHKQPAGPLFDIKCQQRSVCRLHLPHCEIRSTGGCEFLSVAHENDEGIEFIRPHVVTETHVVINITGFSAFGNVKDEDSPPDPVQALVLLFYRPPADPDPESVLNVLLLPRNVVLRDVLRWRKKTVGDERYIETSPHCKLHPKQEYTLSTCPEDSVQVQPKEAEFDENSYDNYFPSFQVDLDAVMKHIKLFLRDQSSHSVWERRVCLSSTAVKRSCGPAALNLSEEEKFRDIWSRFIDGISGPVLKSLLDKLFEKKVMTDSERESADDIQNKRDKARFVIDTVLKKGASSEMIDFLCEIDPFLCKHLGLTNGLTHV